MALPGTLPRLNWDGVRLAVRAGLAMHCTIHPQLCFDRKHYNYHDLPAGYQITQHRQPIATDGRVQLEDGRTIRIRQIHLEQVADTCPPPPRSLYCSQDSGKTMSDTEVDLNRAGVGLIEVVSEPDMVSAEEAASFVRIVHETLLDAGVCTGSMEQGAMRIDVNVNWTDETTGAAATPRVELKNVSGINLIRDAVACELKRQQTCAVCPGGETRTYVSGQHETVLMRKKSAAGAYRYLPEHDLPTYPLSDAFIAEIRDTMPLSRRVRIARLQLKHPELATERMLRLWTHPGLPELFEACVGGEARPSFLLNWMVGELLGTLNRVKGKCPVNLDPVAFKRLVAAVQTGSLDKQSAKRMMQSALESAGLFAELPPSNEKQLLNGADASSQTQLLSNANESPQTQLLNDIDALLHAHAERVAFLRSEQGRARGSVDFFVGKLLASHRGRITPVALAELLRTRIHSPINDAPSDANGSSSI